ncbi:hypothetical protein J1N35_003819 [Gossypium stocksii]|uniref:Uncharacterized protein n=1 Tax=Gossypium stocksii TaxID=47602 RepID=A0A9D3W9X2_9ROSI|nr:hypothetical protein J1N35_003819 [Gossypium stocksii]
MQRMLAVRDLELENQNFKFIKPSEEYHLVPGQLTGYAWWTLVAFFIDHHKQGESKNFPDVTRSKMFERDARRGSSSPKDQQSRKSKE